MAQDVRTANTIWRRTQVEAETGYSRSTIYLRIAQGLWPKGISLGPRAVGWPAREVAAINAARIAGKSDDDIRALVEGLETEIDFEAREERVVGICENIVADLNAESVTGEEETEGEFDIDAWQDVVVS